MTARFPSGIAQLLPAWQAGPPAAVYAASTTARDYARDLPVLLQEGS